MSNLKNLNLNNPQNKGPLKSSLFRKAAFQIDKDNNLICVFENTFSYKELGLKKRIKFEGRWSLDKEHNLVLNVEKQYRNLNLRRVVFNTGLIDYDKEGLIFTVKRKISEYGEQIELLKLRGKFSTDRFNRIVFEVAKREPDILTFRGAWSLNKNNQIIYNYQDLKRKKKISFKLEGYWQVLGKNKLAYILERRLKESLEFKVSLQSLNLYPKKGIIKYRIAIALREERKERIICFWGILKFSRQGSVFLELDLARRRKAKLGISFSLSKKDKLICSLYREESSPSGLSLIFKRKSPYFNYFLRLSKSLREKKIMAGVNIRF